MPHYKALLLSLPTGRSAVRMRVWRAVKASGCVVLRDGVYILPPHAPADVFRDIEAEVRAAGGFALAADLDVDAKQVQYVRALFDRTREYTALTRNIKAARTSLPRMGKRRSETAVKRLRRKFDELVAIDFFPEHARTQAEEALAELERNAQALYSGSEPRAKKSRLRRLDPAKYRGRVWATRARPWVDRLASAWLIRRFIDKDAKFLWLENPHKRPKRAIGFDFDGADFTHTGARVTFEVLLASFALDGDSALASIGAAVHFLDIGGIEVADARGLEAVLAGIREKARNDDEMLREASKIFDLFYAAYAAAKPRAG